MKRTTSSFARFVSVSLAITMAFASMASIAGPFDQPPLHGAPHGPTSAPEPNPPAGSPSVAFFRQLIQSQNEQNIGGRTVLMTIHAFTMGAPRQASPAEMQPRAAGATVTPIVVQWTATSYGQTDTTTQEFQQTWIVWKEDGQWKAGTTGMAKTGDIQSQDHPSR